MPNFTTLNGPEFGLAPARDYTEPAGPEYFDYVALAQSRLTNEFTVKPRIRALAGAMVEPLTALEQLADEVRSQRWISSAVGVQLDGAGYIVGEARQGRNDDDYRNAILFRVFINISTATPESLIRGLRFLTKPDDLQYMEQYPATAMLFTDGPTVPTNIKTIIQGLSPAAISDVPVMVSYARDKPFRFAKESPLGELFVNDSYLQANSADVQVSYSQVSTGANLGGIALPDLGVGIYMLDVNGGTLALDVPNYNVIIDSGYHLSGLMP